MWISFERTELLHLDKLFYITSLVSELVVIEEEDIEKVLLKEFLYLLSKLSAVLQIYIINTEDTYLLCFISFFITL